MPGLSDRTYSPYGANLGRIAFDFFFTDIPDTAKGTASHTVTTGKGCLEDNSFFNSSAYIPAAPVAVPLQTDIIGLQNFLDIRNGWTEGTFEDKYATMWVEGTLVKAKDDAQLADPLDYGLYLLLYGVEGAGVGNDTTTTSALSAVPFSVTTLSDPEEGLTPVSISLLACEQLEVLAKLAAGDASSVEDKTYSGVPSKIRTVTLSSGRQINVVSTAFVK
ncbi:MAG: hypothetical protein WAX69_26130 [Victivallales bacterium]